MPDWLAALPYDPLPPLLECPNPALQWFVKRELLGERVPPVRTLWALREPERILARQQRDGSWLFPGSKPGLKYGEDYDQIETYRWLRHLVELYGLDRRHPAFERAAEFVFTRQTSHGDLRGVYGRQYAPNATGAVLELLVKAGYDGDERVERAFEWLLFMRQQDGGWAVPLRTRGKTLNHACMAAQVLEPDRSRPFSHLVTGIVLRAFAAHPRRKRSEAALKAAQLVAGRLMQRDRYPDRNTENHWKRPTFPFWFTDVVSALDSLTRIGCDPEHPGVSKALEFLRSHQRKDGLFHFDMLAFKKVADPECWISLAVCRIFRLLAR